MKSEKWKMEMENGKWKMKMETKAKNYFQKSLLYYKYEMLFCKY